jgi:OOP family OmpA-OmpF porin
MKNLRGISLLAVIVALSGCNGYKSHSEVEALNQANAVGSPFTQALSAEYRDFANREQNIEFDYPDALHFARKGLAAAAGEVVLPEPVSDWNLKPEHIEELSAARASLVAALDRGARETNAKAAATAQSRFDCWIEQQEENWQTSDILSCKSQFADAMNALGGMIAPPADGQCLRLRLAQLQSPQWLQKMQNILSSLTLTPQKLTLAETVSLILLPRKLPNSTLRV